MKHKKMSRNPKKKKASLKRARRCLILFCLFMTHSQSTDDDKVSVAAPSSSSPVPSLAPTAPPAAKKEDFTVPTYTDAEVFSFSQVIVIVWTFHSSFRPDHRKIETATTNSYLSVKYRDTKKRSLTTRTFKILSLPLGIIPKRVERWGEQRPTSWESPERMVKFCPSLRKISVM